VQPITEHESPEVEYSYSSFLSLTSTLDGVGGQRHVPAALPTKKTRYPLYRRLGGPKVWSFSVANIIIIIIKQYTPNLASEHDL
jgi:hypothetical protein